MNQTNINFIVAEKKEIHPRGVPPQHQSVRGRHAQHHLGGGGLGKWLSAKVVKGSGRGKQLGFPTINLFTYKPIYLKFSVYFCKIKINNQIYKGLFHYGSKPTFNDSRPGLEIHVLDFNQEIKEGKKVQFKLLKYLRKIKKFKTKDALINQIRKDIEIAN